MEVISIKPVELENQRPFPTNSNVILEFHDTHIVYSADFMAEEPKDINDKELGWHDVYNNFRIAARKDQCMAIEQWFIAKQEVWSIYISVNGLAGDIKIYFETKSEANIVFEKLYNYLFK